MAGELGPSVNWNHVKMGEIANTGQYVMQCFVKRHKNMFEGRVRLDRLYQNALVLGLTQPHAMLALEDEMMPIFDSVYKIEREGYPSIKLISLNQRGETLSGTFNCAGLVFSLNQLKLLIANGGEYRQLSLAGRTIGKKRSNSDTMMANFVFANEYGLNARRKKPNESPVSRKKLVAEARDLGLLDQSVYDILEARVLAANKTQHINEPVPLVNPENDSSADATSSAGEHISSQI